MSAAIRSLVWATLIFLFFVAVFLFFSFCRCICFVCLFLVCDYLNTQKLKLSSARDIAPFDVDSTIFIRSLDKIYMPNQKRLENGWAIWSLSCFCKVIVPGQALLILPNAKVALNMLEKCPKYMKKLYKFWNKLSNWLFPISKLALHTRNTEHYVTIDSTQLEYLKHIARAILSDDYKWRVLLF